MLDMDFSYCKSKIIKSKLNIDFDSCLFVFECLVVKVCNNEESLC